MSNPPGGAAQRAGAEKTQALLRRTSSAELALRNAENSAGYEWEGRARAAAGGFLIGRWRSTKPGATAHGTLCLVMDPDGEYMSGFFLSPDNKETKFAGGLVLAKDRAMLERGRRRLELVGRSLLSPRVP